MEKKIKKSKIVYRFDKKELKGCMEHYKWWMVEFNVAYMTISKSLEANITVIYPWTHHFELSKEH